MGGPPLPPTQSNDDRSMHSAVADTVLHHAFVHNSDRNDAMAPPRPRHYGAALHGMYSKSVFFPGQQSSQAGRPGSAGALQPQHFPELRNPVSQMFSS
jgi:hypothetical protein